MQTPARLGIQIESRWHVELDIRNIKTTLGMDTLSCKTLDVVEKEMWIYLLAYNLIRMLMVQSARSADVLPRTLSFKHAVQLWLAWTRSAPGLENEPDLGPLLMMVAEAESRATRRKNRAEGRQTTASTLSPIDAGPPLGAGARS